MPPMCGISQSTHLRMSSLHVSSQETFDPTTDWLLFLRIQKTGTKEFLQAIGTFRYMVLETLVQLMPWDGYKTKKRFCVSVANKLNDNNPYHCSSTIPKFVKETFVDGVYDKEHVDPLAYKVIASSHPDYTDQVGTIKDYGLNYALIVLVREPIGRTISEFKHYKEGCTMRWDYAPQDCDPDEDMTKESFLKYLWNDDNLGMYNRQTRMLAGEDNCEEDMKYCFMLAKRAIDEAVLVALNDKMEESLEMLWYMFGFDQPPKKKKAARKDTNDGKSFFDIDDEIVEEILKKNYWDQLTYDYARMRFAAFYSRHVQTRARSHLTWDIPERDLERIG